MNFLKFSGIIFIALCINGYATVNAGCGEGETPTQRPPTDQEIKKILEFHNDLRNVVEKASDMIQLQWAKKPVTDAEVEGCPLEVAGTPGKNVGGGDTLDAILEAWKGDAGTTTVAAGAITADASPVQAAYINMIWSQTKTIGCVIGSSGAAPKPPTGPGKPDEVKATAAPPPETTEATTEPARRKRQEAAKIYLLCNYDPPATGFTKALVVHKEGEPASACGDFKKIRKV